MRGALIARGVWSRRWPSIAIICVGAVTVAAAARNGPLYERAAQESVLTDQLNNPLADQTGLHFQTWPTGRVPAP
jgi:hypothetical protein